MTNADAKNPHSINATTLKADGRTLNIDPQNSNAQGACQKIETNHVWLKMFAKQLFDAIKYITFYRNRVDLNR